MPRKHSPTNRTAEPARRDDLKLIDGIGPVVEKRLNGVGIFTFTQLAALSPADVAAAVADLNGLSAERILKQDWIGQARRLAAKSTSSQAQEDVEPPAPLEHPHVATPLVESQPTHELVPEPLSTKAQEDVEPAAEPPTPLEHPHTAAPLVEPPHTSGLVPEPLSSQAQEEVEVSGNTEQIITSTGAVEPEALVKRSPATPHSVEPEKVTIPSIEPYHPATFTVELLLDENNHVCRTYVLHVQSRREYTWSDWPRAELVDFLSQSVGVNLASDEPVLANAEEPEQAPALVTDSQPPISVAVEPALAGTLHLRDMKVLTAGTSEPRRLLPHDQPFDIRLTLDLSEITVPSNTPLNYKASIYRKSRQSPSSQVIREAEGTIKSADMVIVDVEGNHFPEGSYRLAATVILALPDTKPTSEPNIMAVIDGDRIRVF